MSNMATVTDKIAAIEKAMAAAKEATEAHRAAMLELLVEAKAELGHTTLPAASTVPQQQQQESQALTTHTNNNNNSKNYSNENVSDKNTQKRNIEEFLIPNTSNTFEPILKRTVEPRNEDIKMDSPPKTTDELGAALNDDDTPMVPSERAKEVKYSHYHQEQWYYHKSGSWCLRLLQTDGILSDIYTFIVATILWISFHMFYGSMKDEFNEFILGHREALNTLCFNALDVSTGEHTRNKDDNQPITDPSGLIFIKKIKLMDKETFAKVLETREREVCMVDKNYLQCPIEMDTQHNMNTKPANNEKAVKFATNQEIDDILSDPKANVNTIFKGLGEEQFNYSKSFNNTNNINIKSSIPTIDILNDSKTNNNDAYSQGSEKHAKSSLIGNKDDINNSKDVFSKDSKYKENAIRKNMNKDIYKELTEWTPTYVDSMSARDKLDFRERVEQYFEDTESLVKDDELYMQVILSTLTKSITGAAHEKMLNEGKIRSKAMWLRKFDEVCDLNQQIIDFAKFVKDNWRAEKNVKHENIVSAFIVDYNRAVRMKKYLKKAMSQQYYPSNEVELYRACTQHINSDFMSQVTTFMKNHWTDGHMDWSWYLLYCRKQTPPIIFNHKVKPDPQFDTRNLGIFRCAVASYVKYIEDIRADTSIKHGKNVLDYPIFGNKSKKENVNIGNAVNTVDTGRNPRRRTNWNDRRRNSKNNDFKNKRRDFQTQSFKKQKQSYQRQIKKLKKQNKKKDYKSQISNNGNANTGKGRYDPASTEIQRIPVSDCIKSNFPSEWKTYPANKWQLKKAACDHCGKKGHPGKFCWYLNSFPSGKKMIAKWEREANNKANDAGTIQKANKKTKKGRKKKNQRSNNVGTVQSSDNQLDTSMVNDNTDDERGGILGNDGTTIDDTVNTDTDMDTTAIDNLITATNAMRALRSVKLRNSSNPRHYKRTTGKSNAHSNKELNNLIIQDKLDNSESQDATPDVNQGDSAGMTTDTSEEQS